MNITTTVRNHALTPMVQNLVNEKFSTLEKLVGRAASPAALACEIEESMATVRSGARYRVEGNLVVDGKLFRAEAQNETLEGAIDRVRDGLMREIQNAQGKKENLLKRGGAALKRMLRFES